MNTELENDNFIDEFLKFEHDYDLFNLEVQGVKVWHYIRNGIVRELKTEKLNLGQPHASLKKVSKMKRMWLRIKQLPHVLIKNPSWFLRQKDILVFNHQRRVKNGKYYDCIYTDDLLASLKYSYYVLEGHYLGGHYKPVRTKNIRYLDYISMKNSLIIRLYILFKKYALTKEEIAKINYVVKHMNKAYRANIKANIIVSRIQYVVRNYYINKQELEGILVKVKPKIIMQVVSYGFKQMIVNELAKKYNIKVIELQHGTMGKDHIAYNFHEKTPLPTFPDYIFLFGEYWKYSAYFPLAEEKLIVTGLPYYENKLSRYKEQAHKIKSDKKTVLFISQGEVGISLSKIAVQLARLLDEDQYELIYKLHPGEYDRWEKDYPGLKDAKNIKVIDNNDRDVYHYFSISDYQVGVFSTAIIEGLGFNLETYIVKLPGWQRMEDLINRGMAAPVHSAEEIASKLNSTKDSHEKYCKNRAHSNYFWKADSLNCMLAAIDALVVD